MSSEEFSVPEGKEPYTHPFPQKVEDVQNTIIAIVIDYSDRRAAYHAAYNWLTEIPRELTVEWLKLRKITTSEDLKRKLAYLQNKHRRPILSERKQAREEFEKWLWENDHLTAAHRMLSEICEMAKKVKRKKE